MPEPNPTHIYGSVFNRPSASHNDFISYQTYNEDNKPIAAEKSIGQPYIVFIFLFLLVNKISSILNPKYRAILKAKIIEGLYRPFSNEPIVCLDTSRAEAKSSCFIPFALRISSNLFFKISLPFMESLLYILSLYHQTTQCQANFPLAYCAGAPYCQSKYFMLI